MAALPFNPLLDSKSHVVINNGIPYCARRFSIFVKKGQMLKNNEYMFKKYTVKYPNNTDAGKMRDIVMYHKLNAYFLLYLFLFNHQIYMHTMVTEILHGL
jgi:hypothetical protein